MLIRYQVEYLQSNVILIKKYKRMYGIGYGLIANAKFCKQLLY